MRKQSLRIAVLVALVASLLASPALAADDPPVVERHGPVPLALPLVVFTTTLWVASLVPCALIAPSHMMDAFDDMVAHPWNAMIGRENL
ncbi:MAG: hypothetical protein R3E88_10240 [Myxococcota bacterium]